MPLRLRKLLLGSSALALSISFAPLQDCQALDTSALQPENALSVDDFYPIEKTASVPSQTSEAQDPVLEQLASEYEKISDNFVHAQQEQEGHRSFSEFKNKTIAGFTHDQIAAATKVINASYEFAVDDDTFPAAEALLQQGSRVQYFGINDGDGGVFVTHKDGTVHLAFRGSANRSNWYENTKFSMINATEGGRYHRGFYKGYRTTKRQVWAMIEQCAEAQGKTVTDFLENDLVVTGHSRGGAMASIFSDIARRRYQAAPRTVTFEAPRALHKKTAARYESVARDRHLSIAQFTDPVYYVNMEILSGAKHVGTLVFIPTDNKMVPILARWHTMSSVNAVLEEITTRGFYTDAYGVTYRLDEYHVKPETRFSNTLLNAAVALAEQYHQDSRELVLDAVMGPGMAQSAQDKAQHHVQTHDGYVVAPYYDVEDQKDLKRAIADTTVIEQPIAVPTDLKPLQQDDEQPVHVSYHPEETMQKNDVPIETVSTSEARHHADTKPFKKIRLSAKKLKGYLGHKVRNRVQKTQDKTSFLGSSFGFLSQAKPSLSYATDNSSKPDSPQTPNTCRVSRGKANAPSEFRYRISLVMPQKPASGYTYQPLRNNKYDRNRLKSTRTQAEARSGGNIQYMFKNQEYSERGILNQQVDILCQQSLNQKCAISHRRDACLKRESTAEPHSSPVTSEQKLKDNSRKSTISDAINMIMCAIKDHVRMVWGKVFSFMD